MFLYPRSSHICPDMSPISSLLTDPDAFFRDRSDSPSLKGPVAVITLIAVLGAITATIEFRATADLFESVVGEAGGDAATTAFQVFQIIGLAIGVVVPYVIWLLYAGLFYGVSALFDADGSFTTTLAFVGWGFVPSVVGSLLQLFITVYRFEVRGVDVPTEVTEESIQQFSQQIASGPLVALSAALGIVFTLWSGLLWAFAMKHARSLSFRRAAITVVVPVGLGVLWSLQNVFTAL